MAYLPTTSAWLSFCQEVMNWKGEHCAPAIGAGPPLEPIRNTPFSVMGLCTAIMMLEKVMPVMMGTRSRSISFCTICVATSGLSWLSSRSTCTGTPPSLPPLRSTTIMKASYWSCPRAPCGPDSSATKPILIGACACTAPAATARHAAAARRDRFFIISISFG